MIRLAHKLYARLFGYFWKPCPVCGRYFGGHEIDKRFTGSVIDEAGHAWTVCPDPACTLDAFRLNEMHKRFTHKWERS